MKATTRRALLYIFMALFIVTLLSASFTFARYSSEQSSESGYKGDIEYIVSDTVEVTSIEDFFNAIRNGYSNIKISDSVNNPLIISGGISNVRSDLTIDLNGHEIQRNNREPLLKVNSGVSLTITDSKSGGSLYNPVGSVLQVERGGTITVSKGIFESGPRNGKRSAEDVIYDECTDGNNSAPSGGTISGQTVTVDIYEKPEAGTEYFLSDENVRMPVITPKVWSGETNRTVNGNMYFERAYNNDYIPADTYLYYTVEGDGTVEPISSASDGSADYYYSYVVEWSEGEGNYVVSDNQNIGGNGKPEKEGAFLATVYIYNNTKNSALDGNSYGAIKMTGGQLSVNGGSYYSYFGVSNTFCVTATGGTMTVDNKADEQTPVYFYAVGNGVCIECDYSSAAVADRGSLNIENGYFESEIGDTIRVTRGDMTIGTGTFIKDASSSAFSPDDAGENAVLHGANGAAIDIYGGTLDILNSATIMLTGSYMNGIHSSGSSGSFDLSELNVANATILINAVENENSSAVDLVSGFTYDTGYTYNYGIYSESGKTNCSGQTKIVVAGTYSAGIYSSGGTTTISGSAFDCVIRMDENNTVLSSTAVSSTGASSDIIFNVAKATINSNALGVSVGGGNVTFGQSGGADAVTVGLTTTRGTGIYVYGGALTVNAMSTLEVNSTIDGNTRWASDTSSGGSGAVDTGVNIYNGIYIQNGSLNSRGTLNVTHVGVANDITGLDKATAFIDHEIKSYAVRVEGSNLGTDGEGNTIYSSTVNIASGTITNSIGGGVYVSGGNVTLINPSVKAEGTLGNDYQSYDQGNSSWRYYASKNGGHAVEVADGILKISGGSYTSNQGNGILVRSGDVTISEGTFSGNDGQFSAGATASYAFKMYGGELDITSGTFTGGGGGAFVMGDGSSEELQAKVTMTGGSIDVGGSTGFAVWTNAKVTFGKQGSTVGPRITANDTGMTVEVANNTDNEPYNTNREIIIYGGTFRSTVSDTSTKNGVWCGDAAFSMEIHGGTFIGTYGYGLRNDGASQRVQIHAGTFYSRASNQGNDYPPVSNAETASGSSSSGTTSGNSLEYTNEHTSVTVKDNDFRCTIYSVSNT